MGWTGIIFLLTVVMLVIAVAGHWAKKHNEGDGE